MLERPRVLGLLLLVVLVFICLIFEAATAVHRGEAQLGLLVRLQHSAVGLHLPHVVLAILSLADVFKRVAAAAGQQWGRAPRHVHGRGVDDLRAVDRVRGLRNRVRNLRLPRRRVVPEIEVPAAVVAPLVVVRDDLDLVDEVIPEQPRERHHGEQPLRHVDPRRAAEVDGVDVVGDGLAGQVDDVVELEGVEVRLVLRADALGEPLHVGRLEQALRHGVVLVVQHVVQERLHARREDVDALFFRLRATGHQIVTTNINATGQDAASAGVVKRKEPVGAPSSARDTRAEVSRDGLADVVARGFEHGRLFRRGVDGGVPACVGQELLHGVVGQEVLPVDKGVPEQVRGDGVALARWHRHESH
eukprot:PhM_4_TR9101/c0_g1_i1/m.80650